MFSEEFQTWGPSGNFNASTQVPTHTLTRTPFISPRTYVYPGVSRLPDDSSMSSVLGEYLPRNSSELGAPLRSPMMRRVAVMPTFMQLPFQVLRQLVSPAVEFLLTAAHSPVYPFIVPPLHTVHPPRSESIICLTMM